MKKIGLLILTIIPVYLYSQNIATLKGLLRRPNYQQGRVIIKSILQYPVIFEDSTTIKDGKFEFKKALPSTEPVLAEIYFSDGFQRKRLNFIVDRKAASTDPSKTVLVTVNAFLLEPKREIFLEEDQARHFEIKNSEQTDLYFKFSRLKFRNRPDSVYFHGSPYYDSFEHLYTLYLAANTDNLLQTKSSFAELSERLKNTPTGFRLLNKIKQLEKNSFNGDQFVLIDRENKRQTIDGINRQSKLNVYIFWASWCVPCLKEIPQIRSFYNKYSKLNEVSVIGVSLDKDKGKWLRILDREKLPWPNFAGLGINQGKATVGDHFIMTEIPYFIIMDQKGNVVFRGKDINEMTSNLDVLKKAL